MIVIRSCESKALISAGFTKESYTDELITPVIAEKMDNMPIIIHSTRFIR
jgi:hypothetical protein